MGSARLYFARDSPCDENKQPYHTGSIAARVSKDRAFRRTPGRRCQVCYQRIIKDSLKRQQHHRHMEHKDNKSCRETPETNTQNGQVQTEHPGLCEMRWKNFGETTTGMSPSLQQVHHHPPECSPFQHHNSTIVRPNDRL